MRSHLSFCRVVAAVLIAALGVSCNQTARMDFGDKIFAKESVRKLPSGGVEVTLTGNELRNPTAAVEYFHTMATKELGGRAYRYQYQVDQAAVTESYYRTVKTKREVAVKPDVTTSPGYIPIYGTYGGGGGGGGIGGGEAAIILASVVVVSMLVKAAQKKGGASSIPAPSTQKKTKTVTDTKLVKDERVTGTEMRLRGTAVPVARLGWSTARPVEVVIPTGAPVIGKMSSANAREFAEAAVKSFESLGYTAKVVEVPSGGAQVVKPTVLRAQTTLEAGQQQMTVEYELSGGAGRGQAARLFVQTANPFGGMSLSMSPTSGFGYRPEALVKPLAKQLAAAL